MPYQMRPLGCDPAKIKGMSERLIVSHYENNYGGAVKRLNLIEEQLAELDYATAPGFLINGLKREQLIAMNSMILHELFFDGLGEQSEPGPVLQKILTRDFGSYERWRSEFIAMGKALGGGSGWVLLSWSPRDRKLVNQWASDHCHTLAGGTPILALDMYEHSYHMDFGAKAAGYVDSFIDGVTVRPAFGLGGWAAFKPAHGGAMVMGDLVLLETEINPVMAKLIANGIEITAVHNPLLRGSPATFYMHIGGHGDPVKMAAAIRTALAESKTPLTAPPAAATPPAIDLDTAQIDAIIGAKGQAN